MSDMTPAQAESPAPAKAATDVAALIRHPGFLADIAAAYGSTAEAHEVKNALLLSSQKVPALLQCSPASFAKVVRDCATLGLLPNGRDAHLVPFGKDCTLVPDYKGLIRIALKTDRIKEIFCAAVCRNDEYQHGRTETGETFRHIKPPMFAPRGEEVGFYCRIVLVSGGVHHEEMSREEVDAIRARSKSGNSGPWKTDFGQMALKTVLKRALKWLPLSPAVSAAVDYDNESEFQALPNRGASSAKLPTQDPSIIEMEPNQ